MSIINSHIRIISLSNPLINNIFHIICSCVYNLPPHQIPRAHIQWSITATKRILSKHMYCRHLAISHSVNIAPSQNLHSSSRSTAVCRISVTARRCGSHLKSSPLLHIFITDCRKLSVRCRDAPKVTIMFTTDL